MSNAKDSEICIAINSSSNDEDASKRGNKEDKNALSRKKALPMKNDSVNQRAPAAIVSNTGSCKTIKTKKTQKIERMAWKNWDQHIINDVIEFAQECSKNITKEKGSFLHIVLYVYSALSKKGINKSKEDIANLLLNPPSFSMQNSKDSPKPTSSDRKSESNCKRTEKPPQQPLTSHPNTKNVDGGVSQKEVPNGKSDTKMSSSQRQKQSENQAEITIVLDGNKMNTASSNSKTSKTETQTTSIDENKIAVVNNTPGVSPKVCGQDDKALKSKQSHDAQSPLKRRRSGATDDVVAESKCSNIGEKTLQTSAALETNIEKIGREIIEKKCEESAKVDIPVEKTHTNTQKEQNKAWNFNVIKNTERNKRNMRSSSISDSYKTDTGILDDDNNKTGANYDISKTDFPKTCRQDKKSLKLKRNHDARQAIKRRRSCAADVACSQGDGADTFNCGNIGEKIQLTTELEKHAENVSGEVTEKKCEEAARNEILVGETDADTIIATPKKQKKSEIDVNVSKFPERNKRNMRSASSSFISKTDAGILNIEDKKIIAINDAPKTSSPKTCKQDGKSLKLKQTAHPSLKSQQFGDTDVACLQGATKETKSSKYDSKDEFNCNVTKNLHQQSFTLKSNTENAGKEVTEKISDETNKVDIPVDKSDIDTMIATPKKPKMSENEDNINKTPRGKKIISRTVSSPDSLENDDKTLNDEKSKIGANYDLPKTDSPTITQDENSLKLKQKHDAQPDVKRRRTCATDIPYPQGDGIDESNCGNIGEKCLQTSALETNSENVDGEVTDKKCKEAAREEVLVEKTCTDTIIATPKKLKKAEKEINVSKIEGRSKRNMRSSSSSDSSKAIAGILNIEDKNIIPINDAPKTSSPKTSKQDEKSLELKQKHDAQPAGKKRRSCDTDVACLQENSAVAKDTVAASEKEIGPDIKTEQAKVNKNNKSVLLKQKCSDVFNEIKIDKTSKRPKKSDRNKRTRPASKTKNSTTSDETICKNLNEESGTNKLLKTDSSKIVVQADVHVPMEINCMETISTPSHDTSHIDGETGKEEKIANESVTDSSENDTHCDVQKPLQTAANSSSTLPSEDVSVTSKTAQSEHIENIINNKLLETVSSKIHNQSSAQKYMRTRAATKTYTAPSENIAISAGTEKVSKIVNEENDESVVSSKSSVESEVERRATSQPSTQSGGVASVNIIGDSAQAGSIFQENSAVAKDTVAASEKEIGPDIKTEPAKFDKNNKSVPLKQKCSDEFNEIKVNKKSKRPKKLDRNKRTRSASKTKNSTTSDETICKNLTKESGTNKLLKTDSSKIVVQADVHVPMEINCSENISTPSHDTSHIDGETGKEEKIANESVTDSSENDTHCDVQKPLQTAANSSSTLPSEDVSVTSKTAQSEHIENIINNKLLETVSSKIHNQSSAQKYMRTRAATKTFTAPSENITISAGPEKVSKIVNEENDESVVSSKSSVESEVERRATSQPSTQSGGVASVNIIGDSAQAGSIFQATTRNVSELDKLKVKPEQVKKKIMIKNEKELDTANMKPKCPPGPLRKAYLKERKRKYQVKKRKELKMKQLVENPTPPGFEPGKRHNQNVHAKGPLCEPFHVAATFWQQHPTCYVPIPRYPQTVSERPFQHTSWPQRLVRGQYNTPTPLRPYWQHSHTTSAQNPNLIYVKPLRRIVTKAGESKEITAPAEVCADTVNNEEPPLASVKEESGDWKAVPSTTAPSTTAPVPQISTAPPKKGSHSNSYSKVYLHRKHRYLRDYFASERVEKGILDVEDVEPLHLPFKKIRLQLPTPQAPPLCSFEDVLPILDPVSSSDTKDQTDPSPNVPVVQGALPDAVCSSTLSQSSLSFTLTTEGTTETAPASETETGPSSQGLSGLNFSPPLSPSMVYPDTPRSTRQTLDSPGDTSNNNTQISEQLLNKITEQVCERVTEQMCQRVTAQVSESVAEQVTRRVEDRLLRGLDDLKRIVLEALKSGAKND